MKTKWFVLFMVLMVGVSSAQILGTGTREDGFVTINNHTYQIVDQEKVYIYYDGKLIETKRVFVKDLEKIKNLTDEINRIEEEIKKKQDEISSLNSQIIDKTNEKETLEAKINKTEEKIKELQSEITELNETLSTLKKEKEELVDKLTHNFLLTKRQTYALITLFAVLVITAIILEIVGKKEKK